MGRRVLRNPVTGFFNRRFADLHEHVDNRVAELALPLDDARQLLARLAADQQELRAALAATQEALERLREERAELRAVVTDDLQSIAEIALGLERLAIRVERELAPPFVDGPSPEAVRVPPAASG